MMSENDIYRSALANGTRFTKTYIMHNGMVTVEFSEPAKEDTDHLFGWLAAIDKLDVPQIVKKRLANDSLLAAYVVSLRVGDLTLTGQAALTIPFDNTSYRAACEKFSFLPEGIYNALVAKVEEFKDLLAEVSTDTPKDRLENFVARNAARVGLPRAGSVQ